MEEKFFIDNPAGSKKMEKDEQIRQKIKNVNCYLGSRLNSGTLTAPGRFCLVLLRSRPDTVHGFPSRETRISSLLTKGSFTNIYYNAYEEDCQLGAGTFQLKCPCPQWYNIYGGVKP